MQGFFSEGGHTTVPCGHVGFFYVVLAAYAVAGMACATDTPKEIKQACPLKGGFCARRAQTPPLKGQALPFFSW